MLPSVDWAKYAGLALKFVDTKILCDFQARLGPYEYLSVAQHLDIGRASNRQINPKKLLTS
jgi:hypothetical protein